jgi:hypothetical protein
MGEETRFFLLRLYCCSSSFTQASSSPGLSFLHTSLFPLYLSNHWVLSIIINPGGMIRSDNTSPVYVHFSSASHTVDWWSSSSVSLLCLTLWRANQWQQRFTHVSQHGFTSRHRIRTPRPSTFTPSQPRYSPCCPRVLFAHCQLPFEVPQQPNGFDCGIYVIHFMRTFFSDPVAYTTHIQVSLSSISWLFTPWFFTI